MNKKGDVVMDSIAWLWKYIPVMVVAVFIVVVAVAYLDEDFKTDELEDFIMSRTLRYSANCLAFEDEQGVQGNVIDLAKFKRFNIGSCYSKLDKSYKLTLKDLDGKEVLEPAFIGNIADAKLIPVCDSVPAKECSSNEEFVNYLDEGKPKPAILKIEVIRDAA